MRIIFEGKFKAISSFEWDEIAPLSILTGVNGVGKTQQLGLIQKFYQPNTQANLVQFSNGKMQIEGTNFEPREVAYWDSTGSRFPSEGKQFGALDVLEISYTIFSKIDKNKLASIDRLYPRERINGERQSIIKNQQFKSIVESKWKQIIEYLEKYLSKESENFNVTDIAYNLPVDIFLDGQDIITSDNMEFIFYMYQYKKAVGLRQGKTEDYFGQPPWEILNEVLEISGFSYRVNFPELNPILDVIDNHMNIAASPTFSIKLLDPSKNEEIGFANLSGGEKIIMSLAMLLYYSEKRNKNRKLLLLDEPDAHLHPSMTKQFFNVIYETLVKKHGVRVILTTHSPSTLAIAPDVPECQVYELKKNPTQIVHDKSRSHSKSISILTSGLILVTTKTKLVFVEDEDDVSFYTEIYNTIREEYNEIDKTDYFGFIPASNRSNDETGGKSVVKTWIERFDRFSESIQGLIDKDLGNSPINSEIHVLNRYSIENYLLDPIVIFARLNNSSNQYLRQIIPGIEIPIGKEDKILSLSQDDLQKIADHFFNLVESEMKKDIRRFHFEQDKTLNDSQLGNIEYQNFKIQEVSFINGMRLQYPNWQLYHRGKNIRGVYQRVINEKTSFSNHDLLVGLLRLNQIPIELKELILKIKNE